MNVVESIISRGEAFTTVRLTCGHELVTADPSVRPGNAASCEVCSLGSFEQRRGPQRCSVEQIAAVAAHYADTMRALGFDVPEGNMPVLCRAAAIQDAWRLAFATVLGSQADGSGDANG